MKELVHNVCFATTVRLVSRFGVLGDQETVTLTKLPRRGVHAAVMGRADIRTQPTEDLLGGFFVVTSRSRGKYTLQNPTTRIELSGVPRRSIRKILDWE